MDNVLSLNDLLDFEHRLVFFLGNSGKWTVGGGGVVLSLSLPP